MILFGRSSGKIFQKYNSTSLKRYFFIRPESHFVRSGDIVLNVYQNVRIKLL